MLPCGLSLCPLECPLPFCAEGQNINDATRQLALHRGQLLGGSLTLFQASKPQLSLEVTPSPPRRRRETEPHPERHSPAGCQRPRQGSVPCVGIPAPPGTCVDAPWALCSSRKPAFLSLPRTASPGQPASERAADRELAACVCTLALLGVGSSQRLSFRHLTQR